MNSSRHESATTVMIGLSEKNNKTERTDMRQHFAFTPYGFAGGLFCYFSSLGFNGQWAEALANLYFLGAGRRGYSTVLMRFLSSDRASPFGTGGINPYAYCEGDPVNYHDNSGLNRRPSIRRHWMSPSFVEGGLQNKGRADARPYQVGQRRHSFNGFDRPESKSLVGFHASRTEYAEAMTGTLQGRKDVLMTPLSQHKKFGVDPHYFRPDNEFGAGFYAGEYGVAKFYAAKRGAQSQSSTTVFSVYVDNAVGMQPGLHYHAGLLKHGAKPPYPETPYFFQFALLRRVISRVSLKMGVVRGESPVPLRPNEV